MTYARTTTVGAEVLGKIAGAHRLDAALRTQYGGTGPMTPDPELSADATFCTGK